MWVKFCRWLGIRLIISVSGRAPNTAGRVSGATVFRQWNILKRNGLFNVYFRELTGDYPLDQSSNGITLTLLGWNLQHVQGGKVIARDAGKITHCGGWSEVSGASWTLTAQFGKYR